MALTSSDSYVVSWLIEDTDIKPKLIKCLYKPSAPWIKILVALSITALALFPLQVGAAVSEQQVPTYSPEVLQSNTAGTTQPVASATSTMEVVEVTKVVVEKTKPKVTKASTADEQSVIEEILKVFPDAPIMVEVARCESGLKPDADRANLNVDVGLFQINQVHLSRLAELGLDRRDIHDNLTYARMLYDESGLGPWYMSKHCWS